MENHKVDIERLNQRINGNWFRVCPICHEKETIRCESDYMQITEFKSGVSAGEMAVVPLVVLTCGNCGNTILLNAINLGLIPEDEFIGETKYGTKLR